MVPGKECPCALDAAKGGECLRPAGPGMCTMVGCESSFVCVPESMSTHVCLARRPESVLRCTEDSTGGSCPCKEVAPPPSQVVLVPMQRAGTRSMGCMPGTETHLQVDVEGETFTCAAPMDIGLKTVKEAYKYKKASQQTWGTKDDAINMVFLKSSAPGSTAGHYMCVVMGNKAKGPAPLSSKTRQAKSHFSLTKGVHFDVFDDPAKKDKGDRYKSKNGGKTLDVTQKWQDRFTDGYCFAVKARVTAEFTALRFVSGLTVWLGGTSCPSLGAKKFWSAKRSDRMRSGKSATRWAYTDSGLLAHPYTPSRTGYGGQVVRAPPPPSIKGVTITPVCGCGGKKSLPPM